ncbi:hypothetical protein ACHAW6_005867 [Cyclotella cf. meneghiniana]
MAGKKSYHNQPRDPSDNDTTSAFLPGKTLYDNTRSKSRHSRDSNGSSRDSKRSSSRHSRSSNEGSRKGVKDAGRHRGKKERDNDIINDDMSYDERSSLSGYTEEYDDFIGQKQNIQRYDDVSIISGEDEESRFTSSEYFSRRAEKIDRAAATSDDEKSKLTSTSVRSGGRELFRGSDPGTRNHSDDRFRSNNTPAFPTKPAKRGKNKWFTKPSNQNTYNGSSYNMQQSFSHRRSLEYSPDHYNSTGIKYRSASSTLRALEELKRKRLEAREKKRAMGILAVLIMIAAGVHMLGREGMIGFVTGGVVDTKHTEHASAIDKVYGKNKDGTGEKLGVINSAQGKQQQPQDIVDSSKNAAIPPILDTSAQNTGAVAVSDGLNPPLTNALASSPNNPQTAGFEDYPLPPVKEKAYDEALQFLVPLRHFADVRDISRPSDTAFFFHVPRAGGSTIKDIVGKCLRLVQASEVGVRDGHGEDPVLQVLTVQESKYVNVDTTTINGIQRAVDMGLARSGMSDLIVSSYFHESATLFDLEHQGRAFVVLRNPIERAVSMYYHRLHEVHDLDENVSIEDYAQGNGIENNWMTRFLANRMTGELTKDDLEQAKEILKEKFLIGFLDDLEESIYRIVKFNGWKYAQDETEKMKQEDCISDLIKIGSNINTDGYEIPKRGTQAYALIVWQTQFDTKLFDYAKTLFDAQTKTWGTKERKKLLKKEKQKKKGG